MNPMLLTIDIGNTNVVAGIFDGSTLLTHWRLATDPKTTADEYGVLCLSLMARDGCAPQQITGAIISSVVPALTETFESMVETSFGCTPITVSSDMDTGLILKYSNPKEIGSDRIVNAAAAYEKFRRDLIIVDFGTATTFDVIDVKGRYAGGAIAPGINLSLEALHRAAAKLPKVNIQKPASVIGKNTVSAIQSGIFFGYLGLIEGIVGNISKELGAKPFVIATGGLAGLFEPHTKSIHKVDDELTLKGLLRIYQHNKKRK